MKKASKKPSKKNLTFPIAKPKKAAAAPKQDVAAFVSGKTVQRLSLDLPIELHTRLKIHCAGRGQKMNDFLMALIEAALREGR